MIRMDEIILKCTDCASEKNYKIGPEEGENTLSDAMSHFKGKTKLHVSSLMKKHKIDGSEFGYEIFKCPKCNTLNNLYAVEVEYDQLMVFKPFFKCQVCNTTLEKAAKPYEQYSCTECGKKSLQLK